MCIRDRVSRANGKPVLTVQAYGAGKVAYWGVPDDWRRAISDEKGAEDFRKFWQSLTPWWGAGGEERLKIDESEDVLPRGMDAVLKVEALSADFEPAMDAMVRADIEGPEGFAKTIQFCVCAPASFASIPADDTHLHSKPKPRTPRQTHIHTDSHIH